MRGVHDGALDVGCGTRRASDERERDDHEAALDEAEREMTRAHELSGAVRSSSSPPTRTEPSCSSRMARRTTTIPERSRGGRQPRVSAGMTATDHAPGEATQIEKSRGANAGRPATRLRLRPGATLESAPPGESFGLSSAPEGSPRHEAYVATHRRLCARRLGVRRRRPLRSWQERQGPAGPGALQLRARVRVIATGADVSRSGDRLAMATGGWRSRSAPAVQ
jgi:hypothetical protein